VLLSMRDITVLECHISLATIVAWLSMPLPVDTEKDQ
jgi:hypothetical protein